MQCCVLRAVVVYYHVLSGAMLSDRGLRDSLCTDKDIYVAEVRNHSQTNVYQIVPNQYLLKKFFLFPCKSYQNVQGFVANRCCISA